MKFSSFISLAFETSQNNGSQTMGKLAKPPGLYVTQGILILMTLGLLFAFTHGIHQPSLDTSAEPRFTDVRIVHLQVNTEPAQGVKIFYVPRNETSAFIY